MAKRINPKAFRKEFPAGRQLSLAGLDLRFVEYERVKQYVVDLAMKRLRRTLKATGNTYLAWHEATTVADTDLLHTLHAHGRVQCWKEAPPWVVWVR